jgi:hypothetical protein
MNPHPKNKTGKIFKLMVSIVAITFIWSDCTNSLEANTQTLQLHYIQWACECANWVTTADLDKYGNKNDGTLDDHCIFLEPANAAKALPDMYERRETLIQVTGQFYKHKGFPQGYSSNEMPDAAPVFRYTSYQVLSTSSDDR